jgi:hypothetical protein
MSMVRMYVPLSNRSGFHYLYIICNRAFSHPTGTTIATVCLQAREAFEHRTFKHDDSSPRSYHYGSILLDTGAAAGNSVAVPAARCDALQDRRHLGAFGSLCVCV